MLNLVIGRLGMSQSVALSNGTYVAFWHGPVEAHPIVVLLLQEVQIFAVEVSQPLMSQVGVSRNLHCQLCAPFLSVIFSEKE